MSRTDFSRLFDQLDALSIGFGPVFRDFQQFTTNYPPHNIVKHANSDNIFILEIAVAGFGKHEIEATEHQGVLTVKGIKDNGFEEDHQDVYQFRGIGKRSFEKKFKLAEFIKVADARLADGLLSITLMRDVPEEAKPKSITIK